MFKDFLFFPAHTEAADKAGGIQDRFKHVMRKVPQPGD